MQGHTNKIQYYQGSQDLPANRYFDLNLALLMEASAGGETISGTATVNATESAEFFKVATTWYRVVYK